MSEHATEFNKIVNALLTTVERKSRSDEEVANLDRLRARIKLLRNTMGAESLIELAAPVIIERAEDILSPDTAAREKLFLETDVRDKYTARGGVIARDNEYLFALIDSIRVHFARADRAERDAVHEKIRAMLTCCLEYSLGKK